MGSEQAVLRSDEPTRHLITVDEFVALDEAGFFDDDHVELIEGEIFVMAPLYAPHARVLVELTTDLTNAVRGLSSSLRTLTPVSTKLSDNSLPEPDLLVVEPAVHEGKLIEVEAVRLIVEVAASSLSHDLERKLPTYAKAGVPEYWVADVNGRRVIRFHVPVGENYVDRAEFAFGDPVPSATIPGLTVDTARLA